MIGIQDSGSAIGSLEAEVFCNAHRIILLHLDKEVTHLSQESLRHNLKLRPFSQAQQECGSLTTRLHMHRNGHLQGSGRRSGHALFLVLGYEVLVQGSTYRVIMSSTESKDTHVLALITIIMTGIYPARLSAAGIAWLSGQVLRHANSRSPHQLVACGERLPKVVLQTKANFAFLNNATKWSLRKRCAT